ncbi:MAG TPA: hypothetical protein VFY14_15340 [Streptomyces sp.]|nr:hypothetical protein [Streptomyces sp.]
MPMTEAEWLEHWKQRAPLLSGERLRDLMDRLGKKRNDGGSLA